MKPSVGRVVHFDAPDRPCEAAIVIAVHQEHEHGVPYDYEKHWNVRPILVEVHDIPRAEGHAPRTWHWPERVD